MIEVNYSITEILSAVAEIQNNKKKEKNKVSFTPTVKKDYSEVPKHTLKLIEEAENTRSGFLLTSFCKSSFFLIFTIENFLITFR